MLYLDAIGVAIFAIEAAAVALLRFQPDHSYGIDHRVKGIGDSLELVYAELAAREDRRWRKTKKRHIAPLVLIV